MNVFDGTYSWDGKRHGDREPITRFPGTYNLKIFNLDVDKTGVTRLKPFLCVFSETGKGHSMLANPGRFAEYVCEKFSLQMDRVIWVEELRNGSPPLEVVVFNKQDKIVNDWFYTVERRLPTQAELKMIQTEMGSPVDACK